MRKTILIISLLFVFGLSCAKNPQNFHISKETKSKLISDLEELEKYPSIKFFRENVLNDIKQIMEEFEKRGYNAEDFQETPYGKWIQLYTKYLLGDRKYSLHDLVNMAKTLPSTLF